MKHTLTATLFAVTSLAAIATPKRAAANSAPSSFAQEARSVGFLRAPQVATLKVEAIELDLDFRFRHNAESHAHYVVENTADTAWTGELAYIAAADSVAVSVAGLGPTRTSEDVEHDVYFPGTKEEAELYSGRDTDFEQSSSRVYARFTVFHFPLTIPARSKVAFDVAFVAASGSVSRSYENGDGFYRIPSGTPRDERAYFAYPLWPTLGFGGGTGVMHIRVRTDADTSPMDGKSVRFARTSITPSEATWTATVADAKSYADLGLANVVVERRTKVFPFGAQLFAAVRMPVRREFVSPYLRGALDFHGKWGGIALGAETDFQRTVTAIAEYQIGSASAYGSAYVGIGALVNVLPSVTPGLELAGGLRFFFVPLDLAFQLFAPSVARDVATVRVLLGVKVAFGP